jgi:H+/Cl- antiporter ClcA
MSGERGQSARYIHSCRASRSPGEKWPYGILEALQSLAIIWALSRNAPVNIRHREMSPVIDGARRIVRRSRHVLFTRSLWRRRIVFLVGSGIIALVAVAFAVAANWANQLLGEILRRWPWSGFVLAPAGLALCTYLTRRFFAGSEGSGIPQCIAALKYADKDLRDRLLSIRVAIGKVVLTLLGLLSGASVGREGPTVQISASIMYALDRFSPFPHESMKRGLLLAGGAAGVAAAFNTPLAGVVFAIEELSSSFAQRTSGIVLTAVISSGIVSLMLLGNYTYFGFTNETLGVRDAWSAVAMCGATGGILGGLFARLIIASSAGFGGPLARLKGSNPVAFAALCGLVIAVLGVLSQNTIYGTGYFEAKQILQEGAHGIPESFGLMKLLATVVSYACGTPGGLFSPSLAVGAGLGQDVALLLPDAPMGAVAVIGMAAFFAGVVQAPITAFVIVMEMTGNSEMALPLMAASLLAHGTSRLICPRPLYKALSKRFRPGTPAPLIAP